MTLRRVVLWRHGETDYNASGRMQGHLDSLLTETGWNQARFAAPILVGFEPEVVVSSDLRRARDTATVFTQATGLPLRVDQRLRETHLGKWQGLTTAEVAAEWPDGLVNWQVDARYSPPGGESRVEVAARATRVVEELDAEFDGTVLLATHGGLITGLTASLLGLPLESWRALAGISNCHWTTLVRRGSQPAWRLEAYNAGITR